MGDVNTKKETNEANETPSVLVSVDQARGGGGRGRRRRREVMAQRGSFNSV